MFAHRPLVSVVTPTYNRADYLPETIESVLGQRYPNLEYIVLDDGSTDNTQQLLSKYEGRLHWVTHPNMGEAPTVNKGLAMARGEFVGVVNSDDPILPGLVERAIEVLRRDEEILVAYPDWQMIDQNSRTVKIIRAPEFDYIKMLRRQKDFVGPGALLRRRALEVEPHRDPTYRLIGDFEYWFRLGLRGRFAHIPEVLATHRVHPVSASARGGQERAIEHMRFMDEYFGRDDLPPSIRRVRTQAYSNAAYLAGRACMAELLPLARHYFRLSLWYDPLVYLKWRPERIAIVAAAFLPKRFANHARAVIERLAKSPMQYYGT